MTTKRVLYSIISSFTEKLNILCLDIFKWTSVLHRGHAPNASNLKKIHGDSFSILEMDGMMKSVVLSLLETLSS